MINTFRVAVLFLACAAYFFFLSPSDSQSRKKRAPLANVVEKCAGEYKFALSIDEGPSDATLNILDILAKKKVLVTMHPSTTWIKTTENSGRIRKAFDSGHLIGFRFGPGVDPRSLSDDELKSRLVSHTSAIYEVIGKYPKFVRFDYGKVDDRVLKIAQDMGYVVSSFNVDVKDYNNNVGNISPVVQTINTALEAYKGSWITVARDNVVTAAALNDIISAIQAKKEVSMVTLTNCLQTSDPYLSSLPSAGSGSGSDSGSSTVKGAASSVSPSFVVLVSGLLAMVYVNRRY